MGAKMKKTITKKKGVSQRYVIVRGDRSGVFAGTVESMEGREVVLTRARRIYYWAGAASLSQLAEYGTSKPLECKFPPPVGRVKIFDTIEMLDVTQVARKSIESVKEWRA